MKQLLARIPWAYAVRRLVYNIPVYMGVVLLVMICLRVRNPVYSQLSKNPSKEQIAALEKKVGLDKPFYVQYATFLSKVVTLNFEEKSWNRQGESVGKLLSTRVGPSLAITIPALLITSAISIVIGLFSAFNRGNWVDKSLVVAAVLGMSVSFLVYVIFGQYFFAYLPNEYGYDIFAIEYEVSEAAGNGGLFGATNFLGALADWRYYCLLPVMISVLVAMGYDTRFYRAVMVEEIGKDYITTARAKGATQSKIIFVHMLMNAMIPIITRIMTTVPFLITGSLLLEWYFVIPGMGFELLAAIEAKDFPVIQAFTAVLAAMFIVSNILTDVLYAVVDPRVTLR